MHVHNELLRNSKDCKMSKPMGDRSFVKVEKGASPEPGLVTQLGNSHVSAVEVGSGDFEPTFEKGNCLSTRKRKADETCIASSELKGKSLKGDDRAISPGLVLNADNVVGDIIVLKSVDSVKPGRGQGRVTHGGARKQK